MKPERPVYAALPLLLLAVAACCCLLFQLAECGRPPSSSPREPWKSPAAVRRDGAEEAPPHQRDAGTRGGTTRPVEMDDIGVGFGRTSGDGGAASAAPSSAATPARGKPGPWQRRSIELRPPALKLAPRRSLAAAVVESGPGTGTDGAGASCHSYSEHTRPCPPSKR